MITTQLKVKVALIITAVLVLHGSAVADQPGVAHPDKWPRARSPRLIDTETEKFVTDLMARMSLEQKVGQMIQADVSSIQPADLREYPLGSILAGGSSAPLSGDDRAPASAWTETARAFRAASLQAHPGRVTIPILFGIDAVHGNNNVVGATLFPHNIALGATGDADLVRRIGQATARETAAVGIDWTFAPTLAVPQDDRWGRTYEGYSESPELVRQYADAMVRGLQGEPGASSLLQQGRIAATAKHFLGDGGTTEGFDQGDTNVAEDELIRTHAAGYPAAVNAGVLTVMASFSSWQGVKMHGNRSLLTDVLKHRLGFDGFVVGDWNGHGQVPGCTNVSCSRAVVVGLDMLMAPASWKDLYTNTLAQVRSAEIPVERIDDAVRRILRVKVRLGLFESQRPWEGRIGILGNAEHRALAREAVRKSLVLLKNNNAVLPIKGSARVLIAGAGADDIGQQSGGWTLSWQGTGNQKRDVPNGQSIYDGLREALTEHGGTAELAADGRYSVKPDVAIVVFGEKPYAEGQGDVLTLEYQSGDKQDLALLKRLKSQHIPVVSVFLSGRPLWVNPELNASDAFVAAWLPGSEGGGIADVLIADGKGRARNDFSGKLSFSWPKSAAQTRLNVGQSAYDPLFKLGYGLTYRDHSTLSRLSEESGLDASRLNTGQYFVGGRLQAGWNFSTQPSDVVTVRAVDAGGVQEAGRQFVWSGQGQGTAALSGPKAVNLLRHTNADLLLEIEYRVDEKPTAPVRLAMTCASGCSGGLDVTDVLARAAPGEWQLLKVRLVDFQKAGANMFELSEPLALMSDGRMRITLKTVRLGTDPAGVTMLPMVKR